MSTAPETSVNDPLKSRSLTTEKMTETKLKELFHKYDKNKDQKLDMSELRSLVRDIYIETHKLVLESDLLEEDLKLIDDTVKDLMKIRDSNNSGSLEFDEFTKFFNKMFETRLIL
jgi:Ca2+-binding EF-hand superfamily protein